MPSDGRNYAGTGRRLLFRRGRSFPVGLNVVILFNRAEDL